MFSHFFLKGNTSLCFSMVTALQTAFLSDEGKKMWNSVFYLFKEARLNDIFPLNIGISNFYDLLI